MIANHKITMMGKDGSVGGSVIILKDRNIMNPKSILRGLIQFVHGSFHINRRTPVPEPEFVSKLVVPLGNSPKPFRHHGHGNKSIPNDYDMIRY